MDGQKFAMALTLGLLGTMNCLTQPPSRSRSTGANESPANDTRTNGAPASNIPARPHPWLATAPGEYVRLINRGGVQIQIDDEMLATHRKVALTRFEIKLDYKCIFAAPKPSTTNGQSVFRLEVRYTKRDLHIAHAIIIPTDYTPEEPWKDRLMKHEMDHVAITTDPRLQALVNGIFSRGFQVEVESISDRSRSINDYQSQIDRFTQDRIRELEAFLQWQYDELDRISSDGLTELADRTAFFQALYDFDACKKHLNVCVSGVTQEIWDRWVKIDAKKLAAHYSLSR